MARYAQTAGRGSGRPEIPRFNHRTEGKFGDFPHVPGWSDDKTTPITKPKHRRKVLEALLQGGEFTIGDLEKATGINSPWIRAVLEDLNSEGIIDGAERGARQLCWLDAYGMQAARHELYGDPAPHRHQPAYAQTPPRPTRPQRPATETMPPKPGHRPSVEPPQLPAPQRHQPAPSVTLTADIAAKQYVDACIEFVSGKSVKVETLSNHYRNYALRKRLPILGGPESIVSFMGERYFDRHEVCVIQSSQGAVLRGMRIKRDGESGKILAQLEAV